MMESQKEEVEDQTFFSFIEQEKSYKSYRIINKRTQQALTEGPQICCRPVSKTNIKQLWTFEQLKDSYSSIVSFGSGLSLTRSNTQNITCQKSKNKDMQMWKIQFAYEDPTQKSKYFWIIPKINTNEALFATVNEPGLRLLQLDRTLFTSLWKIEEVDQNDKNFGFCEIRSTSSDLILEAQDSSEGPIIQTKQQGKGTQKWIIQKLFANFVIRNLCSGLVLSVGEEVKDNFQILNLLGIQSKNCKKIIQSVFENSNSQKWNLIKINEHQFYFQSVEDSDKFLGSLSSKDKVSVYLLGHQNFGEQMKNILWKVKGALPDSVLKQKYLDVSASVKRQ